MPSPRGRWIASSEARLHSGLARPKQSDIRERKAWKSLVYFGRSIVAGPQHFHGVQPNRGYTSCSPSA